MDKNRLGSSVVPTGIKALDEILDGGFLKSQIIILAGNPGAGKTTFGVQFLYEGTKRGEPGIFVGLVEPREDFMNYMENLGFKLKEAEKEGKFIFIEALTLRDRASLEVLTTNILRSIKETGAKRLVIDSISVLEPLFTNDADARAFLHNVLLRSLKRMGVTSIIISDLPYGVEVIGRGLEEFVFDGVITLEQELKLGLPRRMLVIRKLRGKAIPTSHYDFVIGQGGIELILPLIPMLRGVIEDRFLSTGVKELDEMLGGGLRAGSSTLIVGPSGAGKTMLAVSFIAEGVKNGEKCAYITHEESEDQIRHYLSKFDIEDDGNLIILSKNVVAQTPYELYNAKRKVLDGFKPQRFVIDGLTALKRVLDERDFISLSKMVVFECKKNGITLVTTMIGDPFKVEAGISTLSDNVIALTLERVDDVLVRKVGIIKARGSKATERIRKLSFDEEGRIIVGE